MRKEPPPERESGWPPRGTPEGRESAAIISSQAGEHGRAFAVVAEEAVTTARRLHAIVARNRARLVARDGQYQSELAAATYRDRPNMSRILAGMEQRELVFRRPDSEDRRKTRIYLTPKARDVVATTAPLAMRTRDRLYEGLKKKELKALRRALRIVEANTLSVLDDLDKEAPPE